MSWTPGVTVVGVVARAYRYRLDRIVIQPMINKRITPTIAPTIAPTMLDELCNPETGVDVDVDDVDVDDVDVDVAEGVDVGVIETICEYVVKLFEVVVVALDKL
jgi:hypothetical protein